eukprot:GHVR01055190.1.p2 GENE.GHVR01055190.1~~GHVR01055190.1.p2  ORF type:complete len:701 (-),score=189.69 GHVR01055190.1:88-2190(-)
MFIRKGFAVGIKLTGPILHQIEMNFTDLFKNAVVFIDHMHADSPLCKFIPTQFNTLITASVATTSTDLLAATLKVPDVINNGLLPEFVIGGTEFVNRIKSNSGGGDKINIKGLLTTTEEIKNIHNDEYNAITFTNKINSYIRDVIYTNVIDHMLGEECKVSAHPSNLDTEQRSKEFTCILNSRKLFNMLPEVTHRSTGSNTPVLSLVGSKDVFLVGSEDEGDGEGESLKLSEALDSHIETVVSKLKEIHDDDEINTRIEEALKDLVHTSDYYNSDMTTGDFMKLQKEMQINGVDYYAPVKKSSHEWFKSNPSRSKPKQILFKEDVESVLNLQEGGVSPADGFRNLTEDISFLHGVSSAECWTKKLHNPKVFVHPSFSETLDLFHYRSPLLNIFDEFRKRPFAAVIVQDTPGNIQTSSMVLVSASELSDMIDVNEIPPKTYVQLLGSEMSLNHYSNDMKDVDDIKDVHVPAKDLFSLRYLYMRALVLLYSLEFKVLDQPRWQFALKGIVDRGGAESFKPLIEAIDKKLVSSTNAQQRKLINTNTYSLLSNNKDRLTYTEEDRVAELNWLSYRKAYADRHDMDINVLEATVTVGKTPSECKHHEEEGLGDNELVDKGSHDKTPTTPHKTPYRIWGLLAILAVTVALAVFIYFYRLHLEKSVINIIPVVPMHAPVMPRESAALANTGNESTNNLLKPSTKEES